MSTLFVPALATHQAVFHLLSPSTWKTRLSLLYKRVEFESKDLTSGSELRAMGQRIGVESAMGERTALSTLIPKANLKCAMAPLELPDGTFCPTRSRLPSESSRSPSEQAHLTLLPY